MKKVILVTGAAGFIGSHVSDALLSRDNSDIVVAVDEMNDYYNVKFKEANIQYLLKKHGSSRFKFFKGDICDSDFIKSIFENEEITHVCHLAARAGVRPSVLNPYIYLHSNVEGTTRLLDLSHQHHIQNFVFASSSSVYGASTNEFLSETDTVARPLSPYAATKRACELLAYTWHHLYGLDCTGLRFFTVYGPRGRPDMAPFKFIDRIYNQLPIQQYGDGSSARDYTYIDDIVDGIVRAIDRPLGYEIINLGKGQTTRLLDFISLVERHLGKKADIQVFPQQLGDVDYTCANVSKAQKLLGYIPKISPDIGIRRTVHWYKTAQKEGLFRIENDTNTNTSSSESSVNVNFIRTPNQFPSISPLSIPSSLEEPFRNTIDAGKETVHISPFNNSYISISNIKTSKNHLSIPSLLLQPHQLVIPLLFVIVTLCIIIFCILIKRKRSKLLTLSNIRTS